MAFLIEFSFLAFFNRYICTLTYYIKEMSVYYPIILDNLRETNNKHINMAVIGHSFIYVII
jgi:uncharacterized membrane protein